MGSAPQPAIGEAIGIDIRRDAPADRLVAAAQRGNHLSATQLYWRYFSEVHRYMRNALRNRADADEATQQVFLTVFEELPRFRTGGTPFVAWLFTIVRHEAIDRRRTAGRSQATDPAVLSAAQEASSFDRDPSPSERLDHARVQEITAGLSGTQRQVLALIYVYGCSTRQIADVLDKTPEAVRQLHSRALRLLQHRPAESGNDRRS
jgi:RNA polymerase sigma-70 factor (ECF subfamily)